MRCKWIMCQNVCKNIVEMSDKPIGIFDSGMGGLTVRAEIARALPNESLVYFGDGKNVPYGDKSHGEITALVDDAVGQLLDRGVKMVVVACNAATGAAIDHLRAKYDIPIIGMEPAVKPAALGSKTGTIGVLATAAALDGELYRATAARYRGQVEIVERVGKGFVELVENDLENTPEAVEVVRQAVEPMLAAGADRIVLGCTHYPFLEGVIRSVVDEWEAAGHGRTVAKEEGGSAKTAAGTGGGKGGNGTKNAAGEVQIIDSGAAIARRVGQLLTENGLHAPAGQVPEHDFMTAADEQYRKRLIDKSIRGVNASQGRAMASGGDSSNWENGN